MCSPIWELVISRLITYSRAFLLICYSLCLKWPFIPSLGEDPPTFKIYKDYTFHWQDLLIHLLSKYSLKCFPLHGNSTQWWHNTFSLLFIIIFPVQTEFSEARDHASWNWEAKRESFFFPCISPDKLKLDSVQGDLAWKFTSLSLTLDGSPFPSDEGEERKGPQASETSTLFLENSLLCCA